MTDTGFAPHTPRTDWWSRRPRRSRSDSKVAGVAGGLAHYLGVDPILFRVGFVALTILGGVGILAYSLLWLLLPADGDEVSAGEALLGRGQSSVSPIVAAVLAVAVLLSVTASVSWGMPFWPALVVGAIAFHVARRQRRGPFRPGSEWERRMRATADDVRANRWSADGGDAGHQGWGNWNNWTGGCGHGRERTPGDAGPTADPQDSPFDGPAFWDQTAPSPTAPRDPFRKDDPGRGGAAAWSEAAPAAGPDPRTTPPAWDPLGAAPFAWDLPDIAVASPTDVAPRSRTASPVIAPVTLGVALMVVGLQVLGLVAGWWSPAWAVIAASALTVVALGVLTQALRGRTVTLVGPGVLLSIATVVLTLTGITGTPTVGDRTWTPMTADAVESEYRLTAGDVTLDLRGVTPAPGQVITTAVDIGAGTAKVLVPDGVKVTVDCSVGAGQLDCMGTPTEGLNQYVGYADDIPEGAGTIDLTVRVGAGEVTVAR